MSKKNKKAKRPVVAAAAEPASIPVVPAIRENSPLFILILLALPVAVYALSVKNGFVFFDDDKAILYNPALQNPSFGKFFNGQNLGMYAPVSWIAYWIGSLFSGKEAWGYHLLSLALHTLNTLVVFFLIRRLLNRNWPAFFVAALFAVHPVQVEAVSWAAALSTVVFSTFYLLSALAYVHWKQRPALPYYGLALGAYLLAVLAKSAAVTLPLVLVAIDVYQSKSWRWKFVWDKAPFWALSLAFGLYTFVTRAQEGHDIEMTSAAFTVLDRFWMICQTALFYPVKVLFPFGFSIAYPFVKIGGSWHWTYYAAPLVLAGLFILIWKKGRNQYDLLLGLALYFLPLSVMLPFRTVGSFELRSDRYVYLSVLGLFLLLSLFIEKLKPTARYGVLVGLIAVLGYLSFQQTKVWSDGVVLFKNCVDKTPESALCQCDLAYNELLALRFEQAVYHYSEALKYDPSTIEAYNGRGQAYFNLNRIPEAFDDFDKAIKAGLSSPKLFLNRGKCLVMLNRPQEALPDLNHSIELEPKEPQVYFFRAVVFEKSGAAEQAVQDYSRAIELKPDYIEALGNRALIRMNAQQYEGAIADYTNALQVNPNLVMLYNNRGYAYLKNGNPAKALEDVNQAIALNPNYGRAYQTRAAIYQALGQPDKVQADLQMAQQLQSGQ